MRGTFANIRIKNQMVKDETGMWQRAASRSCNRPAAASIYDAAMRYEARRFRWSCSQAANMAPAHRATGAAKGTKLSGCGR